MRSGTTSFQSGWKTSWTRRMDNRRSIASRVVDSSNTNQWGKKACIRRMSKKINVHPEWLTLQTLTNGAKRKLHLKDDKEDKCASRVVDSSNTNQWGKKEAASGEWAAKRKLMMRVGPLVLSLDGKLLGTRRMTKKINVHPEWKTLQTLINELAW
ncbi:hypothetical protein Tco_0748055 [Tanacetum coccineum]|uniref:Uncharacterized protein n=1 Tax=Tanacetum coccineum TaxID=301880 RepID=A0ABQ4YUJ3_9ASTR